MSWPPRTPLPPGKRVDQIVTVACSREDTDALDRLRGHLSRSSYMRRILRDHIAANPLPDSETP